jgi:hypothetical protein
VDPPAVGSVGAGDGVQEGRLAGAVRADDAEYLTLGDREGDVVDGGQAAEDLG